MNIPADRTGSPPHSHEEAFRQNQIKQGGLKTDLSPAPRGMNPEWSPVTTMREVLMKGRSQWNLLMTMSDGHGVVLLRLLSGSVLLKPPLAPPPHLKQSFSPQQMQTTGVWWSSQSLPMCIYLTALTRAVIATLTAQRQAVKEWNDEKDSNDLFECFGCQSDPDWDEEPVVHQNYCYLLTGRC